MVKSKGREELYYRLLSLHSDDSLESHHEDVPLLTHAFWKAFARDLRPARAGRRVLASQSAGYAVVEGGRTMLWAVEKPDPHRTSSCGLGLRSRIARKQRTRTMKRRPTGSSALRHCAGRLKAYALSHDSDRRRRERARSAAMRRFGQARCASSAALRSPHCSRAIGAFRLSRGSKARGRMPAQLDGDLKRRAALGGDLDPALALAMSAILREIDRVARDRASSAPSARHD